jgi:hypothetical protein
MKSQSVIKDQFRLIVAKDIARTATVGALASPTSVADGEVVVTDAGNVILDDTTVLLADRIKIVQGRGATKPLFETATFTATEIYQYKAQAFEDAQQQVTYLGYDAVANAGSVEVLNNNAYAMTITFQEITVPGLQGSYVPVSVWYQSDATATQVKVVNGLYNNLVRQLANFNLPVILAERVASAPSVAIAGAPTDLTFSYGSKTVTYTGTDPSNTPVGSWLRVGGITNEFAVYRITALNTTTNTITLDQPYQGVDATIAVALVEVATNVDVLAGNMGIKLTGIEQPFVLDSRPVDKVQFNVGISNSQGAASSTTVSTTAIATYGHGTYALITTQQADSSRNAGDFYGYAIYPYDKPLTTTVVGQDYSTINIGTRVARGTNGELTPNFFVANIEIACALDGNVANTFDTNILGDPTSVVDVLNAFVPANFVQITNNPVDPNHI